MSTTTSALHLQHLQHLYCDELAVIQARLSNMIAALESEVVSTQCGTCSLMHHHPVDKYRALETLRGMRERVAGLHDKEWAGSAVPGHVDRA